MMITFLVASKAFWLTDERLFMQLNQTVRPHRHIQKSIVGENKLVNAACGSIQACLALVQQCLQIVAVLAQIG